MHHARRRQPGCLTAPASWVIAIVCVGLLSSPASASGRSGDFTYDIFAGGDSLALWIDLTPVLGQEQMEDLLAGLNIYLGLDIRLEIPRPFIFSRQVARKRVGLIISHPLTADIYKIDIQGTPPLGRQFDDQMKIRDFIADSVDFNLTSINGLSPGDKYRISVSIRSKSYSTKGLGGAAPSPPSSTDTTGARGTEFFGSLFSTFLELTGFGTVSFHFNTANFTLKDITPAVP
jgi:hypothetical protein